MNNKILAISIIIQGLTIIMLGVFSIQGIKQTTYIGLKNTEMILTQAKQITSILETQKFILERIK